MKKKMIPYVALACLLTACAPSSDTNTTAVSEAEETTVAVSETTVPPTTAVPSDNDEEDLSEKPIEVESSKQEEIPVSDNDTDTTEEDSDPESTSEAEQAEYDYEYNFLYARALESDKEGYDEVAFFFELRPTGDGILFEWKGDKEIWVDGERQILGGPFLFSGTLDGAKQEASIYEGTSCKIYKIYYIPTGWETFQIKMIDNQFVEVKSADVVSEGYVCSKFREEYEPSMENLVENDTFYGGGDARECAFKYKSVEFVDTYTATNGVDETASYSGDRIVKVTFEISAPEENGGTYPTCAPTFSLYADGEDCIRLNFKDIEGFGNEMRLWATLYDGEEVSVYYEVPKDAKVLELVSRLTSSSTRDQKIIIHLDNNNEG
jgi:hypothetical protein